MDREGQSGSLSLPGESTTASGGNVMVSKPDEQAQESTPAIGTGDTSNGGVLTKPTWSDDELRNLDSIDAVRALLGDQIATATDLGNGFAILDTEGKRRLCGVPLIFIHWRFNTGDRGEFVSAMAVQIDHLGKVSGKYIVNDGSTGIYSQLREFTDRTNATQGLFVEKGLRASDYDYTDPNTGVIQPATTFYIDTSPAA